VVSTTSAAMQIAVPAIMTSRGCSSYSELLNGTATPSAIGMMVSRNPAPKPGIIQLGQDGSGRRRFDAAEHGAGQAACPGPALFHARGSLQ
jgi:hypothetical protein